MTVSDRRVSYASHDWHNSYVCMTVARSDMLTFTEESWQGAFPVNNEGALRTWCTAMYELRSQLSTARIRPLGKRDTRFKQLVSQEWLVRPLLSTYNPFVP